MWSWGDNSNYKCGSDINFKGSALPVRSNDLVGLNIKNVFTGINHMVIELTNDLRILGGETYGDVLSASSILYNK